VASVAEPLDSSVANCNPEPLRRCYSNRCHTTDTSGRRHHPSNSFYSITLNLKCYPWSHAGAPTWMTPRWSNVLSLSFTSTPEVYHTLHDRFRCFWSYSTWCKLIISNTPSAILVVIVLPASYAIIHTKMPMLLSRLVIRKTMSR